MVTVAMMRNVHYSSVSSVQGANFLVRRTYSCHFCCHHLLTDFYSNMMVMLRDYIVWQSF